MGVLSKTSIIVTSLLFISLLIITASISTAKYFDMHSLDPISVSESIVIDNVNIIPISTPGIIHNQQLIINDGRIIMIRPSGSSTPKGYLYLDAKNGYATPGMFDMHVHIDDRQQLRLALAYGVTSVRNMDGMPIHLRWKRELENREWLGADLFSSSPSIRGDMFASLGDLSVFGKKNAMMLIETFKQEGWDQVKVYSGLGLEEFEGVLEKAKALDLPVVGHIPHSAVTDHYHLAGKMKTIEHAEEVFQGPLKYQFNQPGLASTARQLARIDAVVCPTLITFHNLTRISEDKHDFIDSLNVDYFTPFGLHFTQMGDVKFWLNTSKERALYNRKEFEFIKEIVKKLNDEGVALVAGTDAGTNLVPPGASLSRELSLMHQAGVNKQAVLEAATINAARAMNVDHHLGTIEVGKKADIAIFSNNPLHDIKALESPFAVIKNGLLVNQEEIDKIKHSAKHVSGWWRSAARYLEAFSARMSYAI